MIITASGVQYEDLVTGSGAPAVAGQRVSIHDTGWLYSNGTQGAKVDGSKDEFDRGEGMVIKGRNESVQGMQPVAGACC